MWGRPMVASRDDVLPGDRVIGREALDHAPGPAVARGAGALQDVPQSRVLGIEEVGEQVEDGAIGGAGDLRAPQQGHAAPRHGRGGLGPPGRRVVVGQPDDVEPRARGRGHELRGRVGSVRAGGVGVGIDARAHEHSVGRARMDSAGGLREGGPRRADSIRGRTPA